MPTPRLLRDRFLGQPHIDPPRKADWMKFSTPVIDRKPSIWSDSIQKDQKFRKVPDVVDDHFYFLYALFEP